MYTRCLNIVSSGSKNANLYMMLAWTWLMSRWSVGVWTTNFWILMHMVHFVRDQSFQSFFVLFFWGALIVKLVFFNQWLLSKIDVNIFAVAFVYLSSVIAMIIMIIILHECIYKYSFINLYVWIVLSFSPWKVPKNKTHLHSHSFCFTRTTGFKPRQRTLEDVTDDGQLSVGDIVTWLMKCPVVTTTKNQALQPSNLT